MKFHLTRWISLSAACALAMLPALAQARGGTGSQAGTHGEEQAGQMDTGEQFVSNPEIVKEVQSALKERGYQVGKADGKFGQKTRSALKQFQKSQGFDSTGNLDQKTLSALGVDTSGAMAGAAGGMEEQSGAMDQQGGLDQGGQLGDEPFATPTPGLEDQPGQADSDVGTPPDVSDTGESISD